MEIEIRTAMLDDIDAIAGIIKLSFDETIDKRRVTYLLTISHNYIFVAIQNGSVVGFVENFVTISKRNEIRLELDLLAVHPEARGQGVGRKLIEMSIQKAKQLGVDSLRALIASSNHTMRHLCLQMNLVESDALCGLYVRSRKPPIGQLVDASQSHLIWVENLTYGGAWIEGDITQQSINNADHVAWFYHGDILGAVVDKSDSKTIQLLLENEFEHINDYHRWVFILRND